MIKISDDNLRFQTNGGISVDLFILFCIHVEVWMKSYGIWYFYTDKMIFNRLAINSLKKKQVVSQVT